jgi:hypothetical protein
VVEGQSTRRRRPTRRGADAGGPVAPALATDEQADAAFLPVEEIERTNARRSRAAWTARLIYLVFGTVEILIAIRVLLKLIAANPASGFTRFTYGLTGTFVAPFRNIVTTPVAGNGATFEVSSILAIVIYVIFSWLIVRLFLLLIERPAGTLAGWPGGR